MASQPHGPHEPATEPDVPRVVTSPTIDPTELILDGPETAKDDASTLTPETPAEPLPVTVDYYPRQLSSQSSSSDDPLLTVTDFPKSASGSRQSLPLGPGTGAAIRHSVPGYEILREIGRGGMGVVYQARQKGLNRLVALKMILSGDHAGEGERERFSREAESVAALQHPNIVQIFEIGEVEGRPYLAFEFIDGGSLGQHLAGNPWPSRDSAALVEILAQAMQFAHDRGIVHRDLKPGNILLSKAENIVRKSEKSSASGQGKIDDSSASTTRLLALALPKIMDFGLAKRVERESDWTSSGELVPAPGGQTRTGAVMGTPSYIAPEQAAGKNRDVGPLVDVYALGAILYELLTGRPPFRGESALDTVLQVMSEEPVSPRRLQPKVPRDLETICLTCLQKTPAKRYQSAQELADDLRRFLNHEPIAARPIGSWERLVKWAKRHPAIATSLFISIFALVTLLSISFYFNLEMRQSADEKEIEANKAREAQAAAEKSSRDKDEQTRIATERLKEIEKSRKDLETEHQNSLKREEQVKRSAYALALNRAMALVERDPSRAALLLDKKEECPFEFRDFTWHYLRAMCRVDQSFLAGHTKPITQIVYSTDGSRIATSSWDGTIRIWNAKTHQAIAILRGHRNYVRSVAFSVDGRTLASVGNEQIVNFWDVPPRLPDVPDGTPPPVIRPWSSLDAGDLETIAISPDGKLAAAGGHDGKLRFFTIPALPHVPLMTLVGGTASFLAHVPGGGLTHDLGPAIPFIAKSQPDDVLTGHKDLISALVWTKDGLYTGGRDGSVRRWNPGEKLEGEIVAFNQNSEAILSLDVSPGGEMLATAGTSSDDASIKVWSLRQGNEIARLRGHTRPVHAIHFSPDGKLLASGSQDGTVRLWEPISGQERSVYRGHKGAVRSVVFSPDQRTLASGGLETTVRFWSLAASTEQTLELEAKIPFPVAAISSDGRVLAVVERGNSVKVWLRGAAGFSTASAHTLRGAPGRITALSVCPNGNAVASISDGGSITVWTLPVGMAKIAPDSLKPRVFKAEGELFYVAIHGAFLAAAGKKGVQVWNLETRKLVLQPPSADIRAAAFTPDGRKLVTSSGRSLQVWDIESGREECKMPFGHIREDITFVAVGPKMEDLELGHQPQNWTVVTTDVTGTCWVWLLYPTKASPDRRPNTTTAMTLDHRAILTGHAEPVTSVSFAPDGKTIATTSEDRTIRLWDPVTGRERAVLTTHTDAVLISAFLPETAGLITAGREGTLKTWLAPR
ncbi:MAG: protein kinase [Planctomycetes bacterium]|nr:protein kinase [Planctomycetota bacterium]